METLQIEHKSAMWCADPFVSYLQIYSRWRFQPSVRLIRQKFASRW